MSTNLPKYPVKELPSRFFGYPENVRILIQPYTAGQSINIELVGRNNISTMDEVLDGVIVEGMDKDDLSPQDILFLGVYRNLVSSKHDKIQIESTCPKCLKENKTIASLSQIKFKEIEGFDKDCYPIEVDFDDYVMKFEFLTYKAFKFCMNRYRGAKMYQLALQVFEYTDKQSGETFKRPYFTADPNIRRSTSDITKYLDNVRGILFNLVDEDKDALDEVVAILEDYGTKPLNVTCSDEHCNYQYTVGLNEEGVLVTPFREPRESDRVRVKLRKSDINKSVGIQTNESEGNRTIDGESDRTKGPARKSKLNSPEPENQIHYYNENDPTN